MSGGQITWLVVSVVASIFGFAARSVPWGLILAVPAVVVLAVYWWEQEQQRQRDETRRLKEEDERRRADEEAQNALATTMETAISRASALVQELPQHLQIAGTSLEMAETEFAEGAFAPFWGAVESASNALANYQSSIAQIERFARAYREAKREYRGRPPRYELTTTYPDPTFLIQRMATIVRRAQKDFHFSAIYEQRKTNAILAQGFHQIVSSMDTLGNRFERSIEDLGGRVVDTIEDAAERQVAAIDALSEVTSVATSTAHDDALAARENFIQRARDQRDHEDTVRRSLRDIHDDVHRRR